MRIAKYFSLIGIILFVYILYSIGPFKIAESLAKLNLPMFAIALIFALMLVAVKAIKQNVLMRAFNARISVVEGGKIWLIGYFLSVITPGRSGDFLRAIYLSKKTGVPAGKCLTAVTIERVFDILFLFTAGVLGIAILSYSFGLEASAITLLAALFVFFIAFVVALTKKNLAAFFARPLFNAFVPERFKEKFKSAFHGFYEGFDIYKRGKATLLYAASLTVASWFAIIFQYYLIALALALPVSYWVLLTIIPVVLLVEALPISISGLGTRDAAAIFLLSFYGIQAANVVSFTMSILAADLFLALLGLIFFHRKKISI